MLSLDSTTLAQYAAASTYDARAQAIMSALPDVVEVKVYNAGGLVGSGTMSTPWATRAGPVITVGTIASFIVQTTGTPDPSTWYLRFESGTKWLRGTFGLTGSGADFTWSRPIWKAGQRGKIASVSITTPRFDVRTAAFAPTESADAAAFAATAPAGWSAIPNQSLTVGVAYSLALANYDPPDTGTYAVNAGGDDLPDGLSLDADTGVISGTPTTAQTKHVAFDAITASALDVTLTLTGGGSGKAWTFGHPFKQGDVPSGNYITASGPSSFQADVRNYWADGSVKYAVLSGVGGTSAVLSATTTAPTGSNVAEPSTTATVEFSSPATTVSLATARTAGSMSWDKDEPHKVREILGPVMSEFHYYSPVSGDDHLAVWWYVRDYSNGAIEVETVVENGWIGVTSPTSKAYTVTVSVGGTQRYTASLTHLHHTRWSRSDWVGTDPAITPSHSAAYLRSTKLVPNYGYTGPTDSAFTGLASSPNPTPFAQGDYTQPMGNTGYQSAIGLLPLWDALYCTSADSRAYAAVVSNARGAGRYGIHYRDEDTGRVGKYSIYTSGPNLPSAGGTAPPTWDVPHHPSVGYFAYLVTGRWAFMEQCQFAAWETFRQTTPEYRQYALNVHHFNRGTQTTRGGAWAIRTTAQAAAISPETGLATDIVARTENIATLANTFDWLNKRYILGTIDGGIYANTLGWLGQYDGQIQGSEWWGRAWMTDFQAQCIAYTYDLTPGDTNHLAARNHSLKHRVNRMGTEATWNFRRGVQYDGPYLKNPPVAGQSGDEKIQGGATFMTLAEQFASYKATHGFGTVSSNVGDSLFDNESNSNAVASDFTTSYWGNAMVALAYAVDAGTPNSTAAWTYLTQSSNFIASASGFNNLPIWGVVPR